MTDDERKLLILVADLLQERVPHSDYRKLTALRYAVADAAAEPVAPAPHEPGYQAQDPSSAVEPRLSISTLAKQDERIKDLEAKGKDLEAKVKKLRGYVLEAYHEGWLDCRPGAACWSTWAASVSKRRLDAL